MTVTHDSIQADSSGSSPLLVGRVLTRFARGARRLHEDDEGAALVFATITLFSLALATLMVLQVGLVSTDRMQTQTSADAAAYAGAQVEANALNAIGQINDGMAYTHYASLRYVVDQIVYGTLAEFLKHPKWVEENAPDTLSQTPEGTTSPGIPTEYGGGIENRRAPDWVMIGDANEWNQRWPAIEANGRAAVQGGIDWLRDLEAASRLILRETPRLVQEKVAEVAIANGSSHVALSSDLQKAFVATDDGAGDEGFVDAVGSGGRVTPSLAFRYAARSIKVDNEPRAFPSWFDAELGKSRGIGYTQIRLCWNVNDWAHRSPSRPESHIGFPYRAGSPNGHWHAKHEHHYMEEQQQPDGSVIKVPKVKEHGGLTTTGGAVREAQCMGINGTPAGYGGGHVTPMDDDPELHGEAAKGGIDPLIKSKHHAVVRCPTCWHRDRSATSMYSEFSKEQGYVTSSVTLELDFGGDLPRPLLLDADGDVLRSSVTVATWRESWGIGDVLPRSEWGMIAVASAQVGLMDTQGRVHALRDVSSGRATYAGQGGVTTFELRKEQDPDYVNLYHGLAPDDRTGNAPGLRFGARLVPIGARGGRDLTHHRSTSDPVDELLKDTSTRWFTTSATGGAPTGGPSATPKAALTALRTWMAAPNLAAVKEVFWH